MRVFAAVPVKSLLNSKTRLSDVLSQQERRSFALSMVEDVLTALKSSRVYRVVVISPDKTLQASAESFGVSFLMENKPGLNRVASQVTEWCIRNNAESVLTVSADIPLIIPRDVNRILELGDEGMSMVISPSKNGGTNALFQGAASLIRPRFGRRSFMKHVNEAAAKGLSYRIYYSERVAFDIDSLEDLKSYLGIRCRTRSRRFLEKIGLSDRLAEL